MTILPGNEARSVPNGSNDITLHPLDSGATDINARGLPLLANGVRCEYDAVPPYGGTASEWSAAGPSRWIWNGQAHPGTMS